MTTQTTTDAPAETGTKRTQKLSYSRKCQECAAVFKAWHSDAHFCSAKHRTAFHNRAAKRGKVMVPIVLAWRGKRGSGTTAKYAFEQMAKLADQMNAEDRAAGRPPMYAPVERKRRANWTAADILPFVD